MIFLSVFALQQGGGKRAQEVTYKVVTAALGNQMAASGPESPLTMQFSAMQNRCEPLRISASGDINCSILSKGLMSKTITGLVILGGLHTLGWGQNLLAILYHHYISPGAG